MVFCGGVCALSGVNLSLTANGYKAVPPPIPCGRKWARADILVHCLNIINSAAQTVRERWPGIRCERELIIDGTGPGTWPNGGFGESYDSQGVLNYCVHDGIINFDGIV